MADQNRYFESFDCIIVGGGHGGAQAAAALRRYGFEGSIALFSDEDVLPYDRPSLSKDYLTGGKSFDRMGLRAASFWRDREVSFFLRRRIEEVRPNEKAVVADGVLYGYQHLIWSAGGAPRYLRCPGSELTGVHYLRTKWDADALSDAMETAKRTVVIGGGYLGLEVAAAMRALKIEVTLVEAEDRLLSRVAGTEISSFFEAEHRRQGVNVILQTCVEEIVGENGAVRGVALSDGRQIEAELVVAAIGMIPQIDPLLAAGAKGDIGIRVNTDGLTSLADVYCIGDCALAPQGNGQRIESVQNAFEQANATARALCGRPFKEPPIHWFWSQQYGLKLQTIGLNTGFDQTVIRHNEETAAFSVVYLRGTRVLAIDCVNAPKDFVHGRKLLESGAVIPVRRLTDASVSLKSLIAPSALWKP